jgi:hypothetical protein
MQVPNLFPGEDMTAETQKAGKTKRIPKLTRAQIREGFDAFPVDQLLNIPPGAKQLTKKQRDFAQAVALGQTKAQAYRDSYKADPAPSTIVTAPYTLAADPRIKREIEAYKVAIEAGKQRTPAQLKEHLIHQLVQHSINPETPPAQQIKALELIGKLYEVGAFEERKTTTIVHQSSNIKAQLLERLRAVVDVEPKESAQDLDLLDELKAGKAESADPTGAASPAQLEPVPHAESHTIPLKQSVQNSKDPLDPQSVEIVSEKVK